MKIKLTSSQYRQIMEIITAYGFMVAEDEAEKQAKIDNLSDHLGLYAKEFGITDIAGQDGKVLDKFVDKVYSSRVESDTDDVFWRELSSNLTTKYLSTLEKPDNQEDAFLKMVELNQKIDDILFESGFDAVELKKEYLDNIINHKKGLK
jgi:hypothetical protein